MPSRSDLSLGRELIAMHLGDGMVVHADLVVRHHRVLPAVYRAGVDQEVGDELIRRSTRGPERALLQVPLIPDGDRLRFVAMTGAFDQLSAAITQAQP